MQLQKKLYKKVRQNKKGDKLCRRYHYHRNQHSSSMKNSYNDDYKEHQEQPQQSLSPNSITSNEDIEQN